MENSDIISLVIIVTCIIMSAYFSATETAFTSMNRIRLKNMAEAGNKKAKLVLDLSANYDKLLSTILIGNNIVNILTASLATVLFMKLVDEATGSTLSTITTTIVVLIFGEISPKSLAKEYPEKFAMFSAPIIKSLMYLLTPINYVFVLWKKFLTVIVKPSEGRSITEEELLTLLEEAELEGGIDKQEGELLKNVIEFNGEKAINIFTPRVDVVAVPIHSTQEEIAEKFIQTGFSRLPVYDKRIDNIIGILHHKDFYNKVYNGGKTVESIIKPPLFITGGMKIKELMKRLQLEKQHMAIIVDEYGGIEGIITLEDIIEELIGDIWDEHDEIIQEVISNEDDGYTIIGNMSVDKFFEKFNIEGETETTTVGGWVIEKLGHVPRVGDCIEKEDYLITVSNVKGHRIIELILKFKNTEEDLDHMETT